MFTTCRGIECEQQFGAMFWCFQVLALQKVHIKFLKHVSGRKIWPLPYLHCNLPCVRHPRGRWSPICNTNTTIMPRYLNAIAQVSPQLWWHRAPYMIIVGIICFWKHCATFLSTPVQRFFITIRALWLPWILHISWPSHFDPNLLPCLILMHHHEPHLSVPWYVCIYI